MPTLTHVQIHEAERHRCLWVLLGEVLQEWGCASIACGAHAPFIKHIAWAILVLLTAQTLDVACTIVVLADLTSAVSMMNEQEGPLCIC